MIQFLALINKIVARPLNNQQADAIRHPATNPLMIVAGPGSGKTTVLVIRALRHVFVDHLLPETVVITTFTRKAATEIRSRLIEWGMPLLDDYRAMAKKSQNATLEAYFDSVDINRFVTGTLDSLCEEWLGLARNAGEVAPTLLEGFAVSQLFSRRIFGGVYQSNKAILDGYLASYTHEGNPPSTQGEAVAVTRTLHDRMVQDLVDVASYIGAPGPNKKARKLIGDSLTDFHSYLHSNYQLDFALLEHLFLQKMSATSEALAGIGTFNALLVDEYQDTNPLQEEIYFTLSRKTKPSLTVVGDDDQSLYRFRGATVELFRDFQTRFVKKAKGSKPHLIYLTRNYRSTPEIVDHFNRFITNDSNFTPARVQPPKPVITPNKGPASVKVLGMFRASPQDLANDLAQLLVDVFSSSGYQYTDSSGNKVKIRGESKEGNFGDAVLMGHSVAEFSRAFGMQSPQPLFPFMLRTALASRGVSCFNPRGQALRDIPAVKILCGLILLCIDWDGALADGMTITNAAKSQMTRWRQEANAFLSTNPSPNSGGGLRGYVLAWRNGIHQWGKEWPDEWPSLDLCYKLLTWLPQFQTDPEHQVYLEAITRCITEAASFSAYQGRILKGSPHATRSREGVIRDILVPIADNVVDVDEEIFASVPRDRLNIMTIHQSKGLEFPLVIVDVGARYTRNHPKQRFQRFPDSESNVARMEDDLAPFCEVGSLRQSRSGLDRSFEDLIRLYYVAYSRPQSVLLLVGNIKCIAFGTSVKHVATFWRQNETWAWQLPLAKGKKAPAIADAHTLDLI